MARRRTPPWPCLLLLGLIAMPGGCKSAYYKTMETFGQHKRDLLVDRVSDARDDQEEAKEQFRSTLEQFSALVGFEGGDLRKLYDRLADELERCEDKAEAVQERIDSIESVARDLFREWDAELDQYTNAELRAASEDQLRRTERRYDQLIGVMRRAEQKMAPVLGAFRDQVLFLKHNLNAQAVASLEGEVVSLETDIAELIAEMEVSIAEADSFIESMSQA
ncbi:MAG: DUF2959 domain-containing protein [Planctomycetota bacterium]|jgi:chromosome segregation ATPase